MGPVMRRFDSATRAGKKGDSKYSLSGVSRNVKRYTTARWIRQLPDIDALRMYIRNGFQPFGNREPVEVVEIKSGLCINGGSPWKIGSACLYRLSGANGPLEVGCGVVSRIVEWKNDLATYLLMSVVPHELRSFSRLRSIATISKKPLQVRRHVGPRCPANLKNADPIWMSWKQLTHYCKIVPYVANPADENNATMILVNATNPGNDTLHYSAVASVSRLSI